MIYVGVNADEQHWGQPFVPVCVHGLRACQHCHLPGVGGTPLAGPGGLPHALGPAMPAHHTAWSGTLPQAACPKGALVTCYQLLACWLLCKAGKPGHIFFRRWFRCTPRPRVETIGHYYFISPSGCTLVSFVSLVPPCTFTGL